MNTHVTPRALRELRRDITAIPPRGDFTAGRRLRSLLQSASMTAAAHQAGWTGVLFHRSLGPVDLRKTEADELVIEVRATGDRFALTWHGRKWE